MEISNRIRSALHHATELPRRLLDSVRKSDDQAIQEAARQKVEWQKGINSLQEAATEVKTRSEADRSTVEAVQADADAVTATATRALDTYIAHATSIAQADTSVASAHEVLTQSDAYIKRQVMNSKKNSNNEIRHLILRLAQKISEKEHIVHSMKHG